MVKDGVISIDYMKLEVNITDLLSKSWGKKLINKSLEGMSLKIIWD